MSEIATIGDVLRHLDEQAPFAYQESYDNAGLLLGDPSTPVSGILVSLDCTEDVVEEASSKGCNLIVAHHPVIFKGLKSIGNSTYVGRTVLKAIRNNIAVIATHTNLDNVAVGVNSMIANRLGVIDTRPLRYLEGTLSQLVTFVPRIHLKLVLDALHKAGAGQVGKYNECSFTVDGVGTFKPGHEANPVIGQRGKTEEVQEARLEVIYATHLEKKILAALREAHPYEEIAYYATRLANVNQDLGAGLVGRLAQPEDALSFLSRVKSALKTAVVRHTRVLKPTVQRIAICGGAGAFLIQDAIRAGADVFVTADLKYHDFFEHNDRLILADPGHYESEQFTIDLLVEVLSKKFVTFAVNFSNTSTNPISYL